MSNESAVNALKFGTKLRKLRDKITTKKPQTFLEAMAIATKLINLDEDRREIRKKDGKEQGLKRKDEKENRRGNIVPIDRGMTIRDTLLLMLLDQKS